MLCGRDVDIDAERCWKLLKLCPERPVFCLLKLNATYDLCKYDGLNDYTCFMCISQVVYDF